MNKRFLVAVYGTLRQNQGNHRLLVDSTFLTQYDTKPMYTMYPVGRSMYPAVVTNGQTSIKTEIYEVDEKTLNRLDSLEGYHGVNSTRNHYDRIQIDTPLGLAYMYVYHIPPTGSAVIESGDWVDHLESLRVKTVPKEDYVENS